jgi:hypothetical protein
MPHDPALQPGSDAKAVLQAASRLLPQQFRHLSLEDTELLSEFESARLRYFTWRQQRVRSGDPIGGM